MVGNKEVAINIKNQATVYITHFNVHVSLIKMLGHMSMYSAATIESFVSTYCIIQCMGK